MWHIFNRFLILPIWPHLLHRNLRIEVSIVSFGTPAASAFLTSSFCANVYDQCSIEFVMVSSNLEFSLSVFLTNLLPVLSSEAFALPVASVFCDSSTCSSSFACYLSFLTFSWFSTVLSSTTSFSLYLIKAVFKSF